MYSCIEVRYFGCKISRGSRKIFDHSYNQQFELTKVLNVVSPYQSEMNSARFGELSKGRPALAFSIPIILLARFVIRHTTNSCIIKYIGPWRTENILRNVGHSWHNYTADYAVAIHCIRSTWKFRILNNLCVYPTGNNYNISIYCVVKKCGIECLSSYTDTLPSIDFCHSGYKFAFGLCLMVLMVLFVKMFESLAYLSSAAISAWTNLIHVWDWQNGRDRNNT